MGGTTLSGKRARTFAGRFHIEDHLGRGLGGNCSPRAQRDDLRECRGVATDWLVQVTKCRVWRRNGEALRGDGAPFVHYEK